MSGIKNAEVAWLLLFLLYMEAPARVILSEAAPLVILERSEGS